MKVHSSCCIFLFQTHHSCESHTACVASHRFHFLFIILQNLRAFFHGGSVGGASGWQQRQWQVYMLHTGEQVVNLYTPHVHCSLIDSPWWERSQLSFLPAAKIYSQSKCRTEFVRHMRWVGNKLHSHTKWNMWSPHTHIIYVKEMLLFIFLNKTIITRCHQWLIILGIWILTGTNMRAASHTAAFLQWQQSSPNSSESFGALSSKCKYKNCWWHHSSCTNVWWPFSFTFVALGGSYLPAETHYNM